MSNQNSQQSRPYNVYNALGARPFVPGVPYQPNPHPGFFAPAQPTAQMLYAMHAQHHVAHASAAPSAALAAPSAALAAPSAAAAGSGRAEYLAPGKPWPKDVPRRERRADPVAVPFVSHATFSPAPYRYMTAAPAQSEPAPAQSAPAPAQSAPAPAQSAPSDATYPTLGETYETPTDARPISRYRVFERQKNKARAEGRDIRILPDEIPDTDVSGGDSGLLTRRESRPNPFFIPEYQFPPRPESAVRKIPREVIIGQIVRAPGVPEHRAPDIVIAKHDNDWPTLYEPCPVPKTVRELRTNAPMSYYGRLYLTYSDKAEQAPRLKPGEYLDDHFIPPLLQPRYHNVAPPKAQDRAKTLLAGEDGITRPIVISTPREQEVFDKFMYSMISVWHKHETRPEYGAIARLHVTNINDYYVFFIKNPDLYLAFMKRYQKWLDDPSSVKLQYADLFYIALVRGRLVNVNVRFNGDAYMFYDPFPALWVVLKNLKEYAYEVDLIMNTPVDYLYQLPSLTNFGDIDNQGSTDNQPFTIKACQYNIKTYLKLVRGHIIHNYSDATMSSLESDGYFFFHIRQGLTPHHVYRYNARVCQYISSKMWPYFLQIAQQLE